MAIGFLRAFDFSQNNVIPSEQPQCTFSPDAGTPYIKGAKYLERYGPLFFEVAYAVAAGLGGDFHEVCKVRTTGDVLRLLDTTIVR
jgi:hypothetical protein